MGLLDTGKWKVVLLCVIAVWCAQLEQSDIDRLTAGTIEGYTWFAILSAAVWLPTLAASLIGCDLGARVRELVLSTRAESETEAETEEAAQETAQ